MYSALILALAQQAESADATPLWPAASWDAIREAGALQWAIPAEYGGAGLTSGELYQAYQELAGGCLTTCFILSQRDAAARRIREFGHEELRRELLRPLACGGKFATVGLSQLTTSRQHSLPPLLARPSGDGFVLEGVIPWVSGAAEADYLVIGAALDDGRQLLAVLPTDTRGVSVGPPLDLMALRGSITAEVRCEQVQLERRWLLAGPSERILSGGRGAGGLETSALALGLAATAINFLEGEASQRPPLRPAAERLCVTHAALCQELDRLAGGTAGSDAAAVLRARANALVLRATQAVLTASKGTGFVRPHPAQRWARQALFFLVWSCPQPALEATLAEIIPE